MAALVAEAKVAPQPTKHERDALWTVWVSGVSLLLACAILYGFSQRFVYNEGKLDRPIRYSRSKGKEHCY